MSNLNQEILLKTDGLIPIEIKQGAFDWHDILLRNLPFLVTIAIVLGSALVTFYISRKSIQAQEKQHTTTRKAEHENKISDFRHEWIQNLRNTTSELSKSLHLCQMYNMLENCARDYRGAAVSDGDSALAERHQKNIDNYYAEFIRARSDFYQFHSKIRLFFKPDDPQAEKLLELLDKARSNMINDKKHLDDSLIDSINYELQVILKNEWEVTKNRTWVVHT